MTNEKQRNTKTELTNEEQRKTPGQLQDDSSKPIKVGFIKEHYTKIGLSADIDGPCNSLHFSNSERTRATMPNSTYNKYFGFMHLSV